MVGTFLKKFSVSLLCLAFALPETSYSQPVQDSQMANLQNTPKDDCSVPNVLGPFTDQTVVIPKSTCARIVSYKAQGHFVHGNSCDFVHQSAKVSTVFIDSSGKSNTVDSSPWGDKDFSNAYISILPNDQLFGPGYKGSVSLIAYDSNCSDPANNPSPGVTVTIRNVLH